MKQTKKSSQYGADYAALVLASTLYDSMHAMCREESHFTTNRIAAFDKRLNGSMLYVMQKNASRNRIYAALNEKSEHPKTPTSPQEYAQTAQTYGMMIIMQASTARAISTQRMTNPLPSAGEPVP